MEPREAASANQMAAQDQQHFPPPPPGSGAGQIQELPNTEIHNTIPATSQAIPESIPPPAAYSDAHQSEYDAPPVQPPRPHPAYEQPPPPPPRPAHEELSAATQREYAQQYGQQYDQSSLQQQPPPPHLQIGLGGQNTNQIGGGLYVPPPPPRRLSHAMGEEAIDSPIHYSRDPSKLIAYLVPFPKPTLNGIDPASVPDRFLIYTPPPPPLKAPAEGDKEAKLHKVQRKWQDEVRSAKTNTDKISSWKGIKSKATRGIDKAMGYTTNSNLDFLGRVSGQPQQLSSSQPKDTHADDGVHEEDETKKTVAVEEMRLIYPQSLGMNEEQIREEFVNTMLRAKTKAQRDAVISTGLMPVAYGIDILATFVWPFGGLGEIDTVWAYANIRGAKTARSVTKRLNSSGGASGDAEKDKLHLGFTPSSRVDILRKYLAADCRKTDGRIFGGYEIAPTETAVLEAIGWSPSQTQGERNWEDEQWEMEEVKSDLKLVMHKAAKEWDKWCKAYEKDPEKAMKK